MRDYGALDCSDQTGLTARTLTWCALLQSEGVSTTELTYSAGGGAGLRRLAAKLTLAHPGSFRYRGTQAPAGVAAT